MSIPQKNEASLLKKAKNGDKDAFNLMVIKYQPRIMSVLYGFLKNHSDAERKIKDMIMGYEAEMQKQVTERWKLDMNSDSWLSKNIRPLVLVFLVVATVLLIFIDAGVISFQVQDKWTDLLQLVLITVIGAYFGGRSLEKVKK